MGVASKFEKTDASSIWGLLNDNERFHVPPFQRNYAWTREMAETLWNDLMDGFQKIKNGKSSTQDGQYLLGPIVLVHEKGDKYWVIDGQQRLSTITMLFCVARDIMRENIRTMHNMKPEGYEKVMEMLENTNINGRHTDWKLVLNDTDRDIFEQIQEYEDDPVPQIERIKKIKYVAKSQKLLIDNYVYFYEKMMHAIRTGFNISNDEDMPDKPLPDEEKKRFVKQNIAQLNHFLSHVQKNNFVVKIVVEDDGTAYQIFETLNNRGQTLSKSNLIKNHVLNKIKSTMEQHRMSNVWNNTFDEIIGRDEADDTFILESFRSRNYDNNAKRASPKNLYDVVKKMISSEPKAKQYVKALKDDAKFLAKLYGPGEYLDEHTKNEFFTIRVLKAKSIRAPILTAYRKWHKEQNHDYNQLVSFLVRFFFNTKIIRGMHAGKMEKKMSEVIQLIDEGASCQCVIEKLRENYDHEDFTHNFNKFMVEPAPNIAKYVLQQITMHLDARHDVGSIDSLTLEPILPKNTSKWDRKKFLKDYRGNLKMNEFVSHLGNLTLLKDVDKELQNEKFTTKKGQYKGNKTGYYASNLEINKQTVCNYDQWTALIIEERAKILAEYACEIWDLRHQ